MLRFLRIRNFAIIDELELEFKSGLNVITGETGAGKSIIIDAISLILGNRADTDIIRTGVDEAIVEAIFEINQDGHSTELLIRRILHKSGKNKIYLNGDLITLSQLAERCEDLVELCSQHENQSLTKPAYQLDLVDKYGGLNLERQRTREFFSGIKSCEQELRVLEGNDPLKNRTEDFLKFQIQEIREFDPKSGEIDALQAERKRHLASQQLLETGENLRLLLEGGDLNLGVIGELRKSLQKISKHTELDPTLKPIAACLERSELELQEALILTQHYVNSLELNPENFEQIESRLQRWSEVRKKYGQTIDEVLATLHSLEKELSNISLKDEKINELRQRLTNITSDYADIAQKLSQKRQTVSKTFQTTVKEELRELSMPDVRFAVDFSKTDPTLDGIDRVQLLFSPNPGEDPKPLNKVASGGELSRVLLAIRRTIANQGGIGVYLFDEIDAGIGGQTASVVGRKLRSVSKHNQVICITHLPQIAAFADSHFSVVKVQSKNKTTSHILELKDKEKTEELARMLGGLEITDKSKAHAKELLKQAAAPL